jgi:hypothetical protein
MRKKQSRRYQEEFDEPQPPRKSLGKLFKNKCTTPKAPHLVGECKLQGHFIKELVKHLEQSDSDEVICNIAAWLNDDRPDNEYATVELSSKFRKQHRQGPRADIFHFMRDDC